MPLPGRPTQNYAGLSIAAGKLRPLPRVVTRERNLAILEWVMFILDDEELRLRHDLARYRCLLDSGADDDTDLRLRDAIAQTKARLGQLEMLRIGELITFRCANRSRP